MKTTRFNTLARLTIATVLLGGGIGISAASEALMAKGGASQLIQLHAPNNATQSVTVWTPKTTSRISADTATAKGGATKLIQLHAPNSATPSVTIWTGK